MSKEGDSRKTRLRSIKIVLGIILILTALILVSAMIYASSDEGDRGWHLQIDHAPWTPRLAFSSVIMPDGSIVSMGSLDLEGPRNDVWRSPDNGKTWVQQTPSAEWTPRNGHSSLLTPDGSIILSGGLNGSEISQKDVWSSADMGKTWTLQTGNAPWPGRSGHSGLLMQDGSIMVIGGADDQSWIMRNDTWWSTDAGKTWTLQSDLSPWTGRVGQMCLVTPDSSIVLMGGNQNYQDWNDTWSSMDMGKTWVLQGEDAPWPGRSDHSSLLIPDKSLVLMGGSEVRVTYYENITSSWLDLHNDVWRLRQGSAENMPKG
ncbi:MAG: hypothetical protein METHP_01183 [Methanoregula sp. SKADARSKE-2]|nr:MAG: hypothetical protein METHP_01183 [Methanoregula sp. SKADARSKE-2]